ncbi:MAG: hypothetical protein LBL66_00330 [Clostridiales bacterium]|jgi:preprotein translocase subunit SecF|nr:hypothetical protein [Clostridiales bacterium]
MFKDLMTKDYKPTAKFKPFALAFFILLAAAVAVVAIFGFNYDYDYKGGYEFSVRVGADLKDKAVYDRYEGEIKALVEELRDSSSDDDAPYGFKVVKTYLNAEQENVDTIVFRVDYTGKTWSELAASGETHTAVKDLQEALKNKYDYTGADAFTEVKLKSCFAPAEFWHEFVPAVLLVAAVAVLSAAYFVVRFDFTKAFAVLISLFGGAFLYLALMALARVPFGGLFLAGLGAGLLFGLWNAGYILHHIHDLEKSDKYKNLPNYALIDAAFGKSLKVLCIGFAASLALVLTTLFGGLSTVFLTASLAAALVANAFTGALAVPGLYNALLAAKNKRKGRDKR